MQGNTGLEEIRAAVVSQPKSGGLKFDRVNKSSDRSAWRRTGRPDRITGTIGRTESTLARVAILGPYRPPALRPGAFAKRRLFSAARLYDQGRLRRRLPQHAVGERRALANADHPRRHGRVCQEAAGG